MTIVSLPKFSISIVSLKSLFHFADFHESLQPTPDRRFKLILLSLIYGTKGGINRAKILNMIYEKPQNINQIALELKVDYKTVQHHIKILTKNGMIEKNPETRYAANYTLTPIMKENIFSLKEILEKIGTK
ncbi:MAG: ArsR/SmtB family transcription factor [Nitrosopumilaceae archaeon]